MPSAAPPAPAGGTASPAPPWPGVGAVARMRMQAGHGSDRDDAAARGGQRRTGRLRQQPGRAHVEREGRVPLFGVSVASSPRTEAPRSTPAARPPQAAWPVRPARRTKRHRSGRQRVPACAPAAAGLHHLLQGGPSREAAARGGSAGRRVAPAARKRESDGAADAAGGAGDQAHSVFIGGTSGLCRLLIEAAPPGAAHFGARSEGAGRTRARRRSRWRCPRRREQVGCDRMHLLSGHTHGRPRDRQHAHRALAARTMAAPIADSPVM